MSSKITIRKEGPTTLCSGCGRFVACDEDRNILPHKHITSSKWCVTPDRSTFDKTFRLRIKDKERLDFCAQVLGISKTEVIQRALKAYNEQIEASIKRQNAAWGRIFSEEDF